MKMYATLAFGAALIAVPVLAQEQAEPAPAAAAAPAAVEPPAAPAPAAVAPAPRRLELPAATLVRVAVDQQVSSSSYQVGDTFRIRVLDDVLIDGAVAIPAGTTGSGEVTWRTGRGVFGKSAKMEVALRYLELGGRRVPIDGGIRQDGEGNTLATIGAVVAAGVVGGLVVTGHSAVIHPARRLDARTREPVPFLIRAGAGGGPTLAELDPAYTPGPLATGRIQMEEAPDRPETCAEEGRRRAPLHPSTAREFERQCERRNRRRG